MAPLVYPGTDCEDELPTPAGPPAVVVEEMDSELQKSRRFACLRRNVRWLHLLPCRPS